MNTKMKGFNCHILYNSVVNQQGKKDSCNGRLVYFCVLNIYELWETMQPNADHDPKF